MGAIFVQDRWQAAENVAYTAGARFSYIGFLADRNHVDPFAAVELRRDERTRVRGTVSSRTIVPGGDLLTLSVLGSAPAMAFAVMDDQLRPERAMRYELTVDQALGSATLSARTFYEGVTDQLVNAFTGASAARTLRIVNGGGLQARGMGLTVTRRFGDAFSGSVTYTYGHSWRRAPVAVTEAGALPDLFAYHDADFHDVVGRIETFIDWSDTRVIAFYRLNRLTPEVEGKIVEWWKRGFYKGRAGQRALRRAGPAGPALPGRAHAGGLGVPARGAEPLLRDVGRGQPRRGHGVEPAQAGAGRNLGPVLSHDPDCLECGVGPRVPRSGSARPG